MSQRILIRHSTGSKASTIEEFPLKGPQELTFGRDPACDIRFDKDKDEFVSRRHMKLVVGDPDKRDFTVVDLKAINGTFVNRHRVTGSVKVQPGDVVQLGAGGPKFVFELAAEDLKVTPRSGVVPVGDLPGIPVESGPVPEASDSAPVSDARQSQRATNRPRPKGASRKNRIAGVAFLIVACAAALHLAGGRDGQAVGRVEAAARAAIERVRRIFQSEVALSPSEIARENANSLVVIEHSWRLIDPASGRQLRQVYIPNRRGQSDSGAVPLIPGGGPELPVFVLLAANRLQPLLTVADNVAYRPIGGKSHCAGFVATVDRLIVTTRSCVTPWSAPYGWPENESAAVVVVFDKQFKLTQTAVIARRQFPRWLPVETDFVLGDAFNQDSVTVNSGIRGSGKSDSLIVSFPGLHQEAPATGVSAADVNGLATVRPNAPIPVRTVSLASETGLKPGDEVVILMPSGSGPIIAKLAAVRAGGGYEFFPGAGARGAAGAPVFDRRGRVVAVETESDPLRPERAVAVPIVQALESLGQTLSPRQP